MHVIHAGWDANPCTTTLQDLEKTYGPVKNLTAEGKETFERHLDLVLDSYGQQLSAEHKRTALPDHVLKSKTLPTLAKNARNSMPDFLQYLRELTQEEKLSKIDATGGGNYHLVIHDPLQELDPLFRWLKDKGLFVKKLNRLLGNPKPVQVYPGLGGDFTVRQKDRVAKIKLIASYFLDGSYKEQKEYLKVASLDTILCSFIFQRDPDFVKAAGRPDEIAEELAQLQEESKDDAQWPEDIDDEEADNSDDEAEAATTEEGEEQVEAPAAYPVPQHVQVMFIPTSSSSVRRIRSRREAMDIAAIGGTAIENLLNRIPGGVSLHAKGSAATVDLVKRALAKMPEAGCPPIPVTAFQPSKREVVQKRNGNFVEDSGKYLEVLQDYGTAIGLPDELVKTVIKVKDLDPDQSTYDDSDDSESTSTETDEEVTVQSTTRQRRQGLPKNLSPDEMKRRAHAAIQETALIISFARQVLDAFNAVAKEGYSRDDPAQTSERLKFGECKLAKTQDGSYHALFSIQHTGQISRCGHEYASLIGSIGQGVLSVAFALNVELSVSGEVLSGKWFEAFMAIPEVQAVIRELHDLTQKFHALSKVRMSSMLRTGGPPIYTHLNKPTGRDDPTAQFHPLYPPHQSNSPHLCEFVFHVRTKLPGGGFKLIQAQQISVRLPDSFPADFDWSKSNTQNRPVCRVFFGEDTFEACGYFEDEPIEMTLKHLSVKRFTAGAGLWELAFQQGKISTRGYHSFRIEEVLSSEHAKSLSRLASFNATDTSEGTKLMVNMSLIPMIDPVSGRLVALNTLKSQYRSRPVNLTSGKKYFLLVAVPNEVGRLALVDFTNPPDDPSTARFVTYPDSSQKNYSNAILYFSVNDLGAPFTDVYYNDFPEHLALRPKKQAKMTTFLAVQPSGNTPAPPHVPQASGSSTVQRKQPVYYQEIFSSDEGESDEQRERELKDASEASRDLADLEMEMPRLSESGQGRERQPVHYQDQAVLGSDEEEDEDTGGESEGSPMWTISFKGKGRAPASGDEYFPSS